MLRAIISTNSSNAVSYFTGGLADSELYLDGVGRSEWLGEAALALGLKGPVERAAFKALCENRHPVTGEQLTPRMRADRRVGVDMNFHVPKSVSVVYALGGDKALREAVWSAVTFTMRAFEAWAETRVRENGANVNRLTGNLVWAQFLHETTRPIDGIPDPHLHIHCFVHNGTYDKTENRWKAVQLGSVWEHMPFFEAMFLSTLARRVDALGYGIRTTDRAWEIDGVSPEVLKMFSRRTAEVNEMAAARGTTDKREKAKYGTYTRKAKSTSRPMDDVRKDWEERVSQEELHNISRCKGKARDLTSTRSLQEAIRYAVAKTFENSAVVKETALLAEVLRACPGQMTVAGIRAEYERHGVIVRESKGEKVVTTRAAWAEERRLIELARVGRGQVRRLVALRSYNLPGLTSYEQSAVWSVLQSADLVTVVQSRGVGQARRLVREIADLCATEINRSFVVYSATAAGLTKHWHDRGTVAQLLSSPKMQSQMPVSVVWITDAHKLTIKATAALIEFVASRGSRLVLCADKLSRGSIFRGSPIDVLERHAGVASFEIDTVRRQRGEYAEAVKALNRGDVHAGVDILTRMGGVKQVTSESLYPEAAKLVAEKMTSRRKAIVVTPTRAAAQEVTTAVRAELLERGRIRKERSITRLVKKNMAEIDKTRTSSYAKGDIIEFTQKVGRFSPRERWTVTGTTLLGYVEVRKGVKLATLPLRRPERFDVYTSEPIKVGVGDYVRITKSGMTRAVVDIPLGVVSKKHTRATRQLRASAIHRIKEFTALGHAVLDNGFILKRSFGHIEYGYATTAASSVSHAIDHVVCVQPKDAGRAASIEQLAHSVGVGTKSATIVTDSKNLKDLVSRSSESPLAHDVVADGISQELRAVVREKLEATARQLFGVRAPSREVERHLERERGS